ncbi:GDP-mannose transporter into the lumen of the Golgi [Blastocladiella emersonii ATCC 22665]|nr:GDP-mannose transporter into the lumen of the Golgi [Blastocladiella emersonii ATCC 22665]
MSSSPLATMYHRPHSPLLSGSGNAPGPARSASPPPPAPASDLFSPAWIPPIIAYCASSILMTLTNKLVLSGFPYRMVFLILAVQCIASAVLLELARAFGPRRFFSFTRPVSAATLRAWLPVACSMAAMLYTGGMALAHLPVGVFTIFKNLTIIVIALAERATVGTPITLAMAVSFALMVLSSGITAHADLGAADEVTAASAAGYAWVLANCATSAFFVLHMRRTIKALRLRDLETVYLNNMLAAPLFLVLSALVDPWAELQDPDHIDAAAPFLTAAVMSGLTAFAISFASAWCVRVVNTTTYSVVGALNKLPVSLAGLLFLEEPATPGLLVGIGLGFSAGLLYSKAKRASDKARSRTAAVAPAAGPPVELSSVHSPRPDGAADHDDEDAGDGATTRHPLLKSPVAQSKDVSPHLDGASTVRRI